MHRYFVTWETTGPHAGLSGSIDLSLQQPVHSDADLDFIKAQIAAGAGQGFGPEHVRIRERREVA